MNDPLPVTRDLRQGYRAFHRHPGVMWKGRNGLGTRYALVVTLYSSSPSGYVCPPTCLLAVAGMLIGSLINYLFAILNTHLYNKGSSEPKSSTSSGMTGVAIQGTPSSA